MTMKIFFCVVLTLILKSGAAPTNPSDLTNCPSTLTHNEDPKYLRTFRTKCYEFVVYRERYWDQAHQACAAKGGHLVTIPDNSTQQFLIDSLTELKAQNHGLWIGLNDRHSEGKFEWDTGALLTYTHWVSASGPHHTFINSINDCFTMRMSDNWKWEDYHCHLWPQHYGYICEYNMKHMTHVVPCTPINLCDMDCSHYGYKADPETFCPRCQCNNPPPSNNPTGAIVG